MKIKALSFLSILALFFLSGDSSEAAKLKLKSCYDIKTPHQHIVFRVYKISETEYTGS